MLGKEEVGDFHRAFKARFFRRTIVLLLISLQLTACTTFKPTGHYDKDLQQRIIAGQVLSAGEDVIIHTDNGRKYDVVVEEVSATHILVAGIEGGIPIESVVAVDKYQIDWSETGRGVTIFLLAPLVVFAALLTNAIVF